MSEQEITQDTTQVVETPIEPESQPKQKRPKRKCSQKQLAALAAGRAKNKHFKPKSGT